MISDVFYGLESLTKAGLHLSLDVDGALVVTPASRLTPDNVAWIREHKAELVEALRTAPEPTAEAWCWYTGAEPADYFRARRPAPTPHPGYPRPSPAAVEAHEALMAHLMSGAAKAANCCHAPVGRYCPVGAALRDALDVACREVTA